MNKTDRAALLSDTIACLRAYKVEHAGSLRGSPVVADSWPHAAYYFVINDNGGEFHVHRINSSTPGRSVAYETTKGDMDAGTMAYRIKCVMRGEKIDWKLLFTDEDAQIMKEAA
jgi:hypothetical protein